MTVKDVEPETTLGEILTKGKMNLQVNNKMFEVYPDYSTLLNSYDNAKNIAKMESLSP